jgi:hypothetical protein
VKLLYLDVAMSYEWWLDQQRAESRRGWGGLATVCAESGSSIAKCTGRLQGAGFELGGPPGYKEKMFPLHWNHYLFVKRWHPHTL